MITCWVEDCVFRGRPNETAVVVFSKYDHGFSRHEKVSKEWIMDNLTSLNPQVIKTKKTKIVKIHDNDLKK